MVARGSRVRFVVLAFFGIIAVSAVALMMRPGPAPIVADDTPRFSMTGEAARAALAPRWTDPMASGSGTRCREASMQDTVWRTCESATGQLMTVTASSPVFVPAIAEALVVVLHAGETAMQPAWLAQLASVPEVERCTTAGPLWRKVVDGRVVVGSVGRCPA